MDEIKKSRPALSTSGLPSSNEETVSVNNNSKSVPGFQVSALLRHGSGSGISGPELSALLGVDGRELRQAVKNERDSGSLILSGVSGYFLPSKNDEERRQELLKQYHAQLARLRGMSPFLRVLEQALDILPEQIALDEQE